MRVWGTLLTVVTTASRGDEKAFKELAKSLGIEVRK